MSVVKVIWFMQDERRQSTEKTIYRKLVSIRDDYSTVEIDASATSA